jgi:hypothetical protein
MGQYKDLLESILSENWVVSKDANGNKILINKLTGEKKPMAVANTPVAKYLGKSMEKPMALPGDEPEEDVNEGGDLETNYPPHPLTTTKPAPDEYSNALSNNAKPAVRPSGDVNDTSKDISFDHPSVMAKSPAFHKTSGIMPRRR